MTPKERIRGRWWSGLKGLGLGFPKSRYLACISGMSCAAFARVEKRLKNASRGAGGSRQPGHQQGERQLYLRHDHPFRARRQRERTGLTRSAQGLSFDEVFGPGAREERQLARFIIAVLFTLPLTLMMIFSHVGIIL